MFLVTGTTMQWMWTDRPLRLVYRRLSKNSVLLQRIPKRRTVGPADLVYFESTAFQKTCALLGIRKTGSTSMHRQSDGMVKRLNSILEMSL